tara:strand:+ start:732 stop:1772 length:1041 start_codon:yes stop_codon:yes gene_type:complete
MAKISNTSAYPNQSPVAVTDYLIGTDASDLSTKTFTVQDLANAIDGQVTLQEVLDAGNSATQSLTLTGNFTTTGTTTINSLIYVDARHPHGELNLSYGLDSLNQGALVVGSKNTAIGLESLYAALGAQNNTAVGYQSLLSITTGNSNTAIGRNAGSSTSVGVDNNVFIGADAGKEATNNNNVVVGYNAGKKATTESVYIGASAGPTAANHQNTVVGFEGMASATTARENTAIGWQAANNTIDGDGNTVVGSQSRPTAASTTGATALGAESIANTSAVALGKGANASIVGSVAFSSTIGAAYGNTALLQAPNNAGAAAINVPIGGLYVVGPTGGAAADPATIAIRTA